MAHLKLCPHRLAQLTSSSDTPPSAAHLKLYYTVYRSSPQALLHRLAQLTSSSALAV